MCRVCCCVRGVCVKQANEEAKPACSAGSRMRCTPCHWKLLIQVSAHSTPPFTHTYFPHLPPPPHTHITHNAQHTLSPQTALYTMSLKLLIQAAYSTTSPWRVRSIRKAPLSVSRLMRPLPPFSASCVIVGIILYSIYIIVLAQLTYLACK